MRRSIPHCPVCNGTMEPVKLRCSSCHIVVEGELPVSRLALLTDAHQQFIEVFLLARGNIKEMEKELRVSYPTVRKRLEEVVQALGYPAVEKRLNQRTILDAVDRGELSPQEAIAQLRGL